MIRWMSSAAMLFALSLLTIASCSTSGRAVSVDLRTDLVPGVEFSKVVTKIDDAQTVDHGATELPSQYIAGARVADFSELAEGNVLVKVTLLDKDGTELVSRLSRVDIKQDFALTVVVTRSCAGAVCPEPEGDPDLTTCQAGHGTRPECTPETPESCPASECASDGDCRTEISCLAPSCDHGVCLFPPNDALCAKGQTCNPNQGCVAADGTPVCTATAATEQSCSDHADDDCNGRIDCLDDACAGSSCEDGDACTQGETCASTACGGGQAISCDDMNPCTDDACDPAKGCTHTDNTTPCDDGDACTTSDVCAAGACKPGTATPCDDQNSCTDDACNPATGCTHADNTAACDDGNVCTTLDVCAGGACKPGPAKSCDDQNPCTDDTCDPAAGCGHANNAGACNDNVFCNGVDKCQGGACSIHPGSPCAQLCNEQMDSCVGCLVTADCGPITYGVWSACGGFAAACDTTGTRSRTVSTPLCTGGACSMTPSVETEACARPTDGDSCGAPTYGAWSACGGFASTCDTMGTRTRSVTTPTCQSDTCAGVASTETQACARTTNGVSCGATAYGAWSACGGFSSACDTTGTRTRSVTTFTCAGGSCPGAPSTESQSCTRAVTNGTSCGGGSYCCSGSCVSKSSSTNCGGCGIVCAGGKSCGSPVSGQWDCRCSTNSECVNGGYGSGATCYTDGTGAFCNCQCPGGATSCGGQCGGGATCHDVSGHNYCSYP
ncbi:MAG: hypothetical protein ABI134_15110 [Byssovorax sp.]